MAIRSRTNQYVGVNAHFNSYAQNVENGWKSFHTRYIVALGDLLDAALPPGYELKWESSLQIREVDPNTGEPLQRPKKPEPDITIWQLENAQAVHQPAISPVTPILVKPAVEVLSQDEEHYYEAIVIYEQQPGEIGVPVARIELLSPSNKPGGSNYEKYLIKQDMALREGHTSLTVIDFLHQTDSPIPGLPSYPRRDPNAYPYTITIIDPRPTLQTGEARVYGMRVDDPLPILPIPLAGSDVVAADFGQAYHLTYQAAGSFSNPVDYTEKPLRFETYAEIDQQRILARMAAVQAALG